MSGGEGPVLFVCGHCVRCIGDDEPVYMRRDAAFCSLNCRHRGPVGMAGAAQPGEVDEPARPLPPPPGTSRSVQRPAGPPPPTLMPTANMTPWSLPRRSPSLSLLSPVSDWASTTLSGTTTRTSGGSEEGSVVCPSERAAVADDTGAGQSYCTGAHRLLLATAGLALTKLVAIVARGLVPGAMESGATVQCMWRRGSKRSSSSARGSCSVGAPGVTACGTTATGTCMLGALGTAGQAFGGAGPLVA